MGWEGASTLRGLLYLFSEDNCEIEKEQIRSGEPPLAADPGFPTRQAGGTNLLFCQNFPEKCMKIREIGPRQWRIQDFPEEGALTPKGGRQPIIWPIFPENCMKKKKSGTKGGGAHPLRPP